MGPRTVQQIQVLLYFRRPIRFESSLFAYFVTFRGRVGLNSSKCFNTEGYSVFFYFVEKRVKRHLQYTCPIINLIGRLFFWRLIKLEFRWGRLPQPREKPRMWRSWMYRVRNFLLVSKKLLTSKFQKMRSCALIPLQNGSLYSKVLPLRWNRWLLWCQN